MKKLFSAFLVCIMLLGLIPTVSAASAYWGGPDTVRAGDTITLTFYAGGGIYGGSGDVSFNSSQLTLQGYTATIGGNWRVEFNGNRFLFYDDSMTAPISGSSSIFKATFKVSSSLEPGAEIAVTASGVTLSAGEQDMGAGSPVYRKTIAPPLSDNCNLAALTVSNATISPAFSPSVTSYSTSVPFTTGSLQVSAEAEHEAAKVSIGSTSLAAGTTTAVSITVTAENGATKTYTIRAKRAQDPNYVPSSNATLKDLSVEGFPISPAFKADVDKYYIWLPYETETVSLNAEKADGKASLQIGEQPELIPGKAVPMTVTVTAEDNTQKVYTVNIFRAPAYGDTEKFLNGEREPEPTEPPTEAPEVVPTEPVPEVPQETGAPAWVYVLIGIAGALAGAGITAVLFLLTQKKKNKA